MSRQMVIEVPDDLFDDVQRLAKRRQEPVEAILVDTLRRAFPQWPVHPKREQMEAEQAAFEEMRPALQARYRGEFVAIHEGKMVDHDNDEVNLLKRVQAQFPDQLVLIREVTEEPLPMLHFRSPRFVRDS